MRSACKQPSAKNLVNIFGGILYKSFGVFLFCFIALRFFGFLQASHVLKNEYEHFSQGMRQDFLHLKEQGDELAQQDAVIQAVGEQDSETLLQITQDATQERDIGLIGIADKYGTILSRTLSPGKIGDNVFLTAPAGRVVANGVSVESVELTSFFDQIFMTTARPVMNSEGMIGALFANRLLDNEYAQKISHTYLSEGVEIAFYSKEFGIYGSSFTDETHDNLLRSYFNTGSDWIKEGMTEKVVSFSDNEYFLVENIPLESIGDPVGGALLFIPRKDFSQSLAILPLIISLCTLFFFTWKEHACFTKKGLQVKYKTLSFLVLSLVILGVIFFTSLQRSSYLRIIEVPYSLYNSTMHLQPEWGIYNLGFEQSFEIIVETGGEPINAIQATLHFDPLLVNVQDIDTSNSACSFFIEKAIKPEEGTLTISCILLEESMKSHRVKVGTVRFNPLKSGTIDFLFDQEKTQVLANDGLGTSVLRSMQNGSYRVGNFSPTLYGSEDVDTEDQRSFMVFSSTHPNQERWYNKNAAEFIWRGEEGENFKGLI